MPGQRTPPLGPGSVSSLRARFPRILLDPRAEEPQPDDHVMAIQSLLVLTVLHDETLSLLRPRVVLFVDGVDEGVRLLVFLDELLQPGKGGHLMNTRDDQAEKSAVRTKSRAMGDAGVSEVPEWPVS